MFIFHVRWWSVRLRLTAVRPKRSWNVEKILKRKLWKYIDKRSNKFIIKKKWKIDNSEAISHFSHVLWGMGIANFSISFLSTAIEGSNVNKQKTTNIDDFGENVERSSRGGKKNKQKEKNKTFPVDTHDKSTFDQETFDPTNWPLRICIFSSKNLLLRKTPVSGRCVVKIYSLMSSAAP